MQGEVDDEQIEVVELSKYIGTLKLTYGNCSKATRSRIGMTKRRVIDLVPRNKQRAENRINKELKIELVGSIKNYTPSALDGVNCSHIWTRMVDSDET